MRPSRVSATRLPAKKATTTRKTPAPRAAQRILIGAGEEVGSQPPHAAQPAVVVLGLAAEVFGYLWMRKDQELFGSDALDNHVSHLLGFESALGQEIVTKDALLGRKHVGLHTLRAHARDADPIIPMRDRQPLEERERRRLRHAVWSCEDVVEQARRGHGAEQVTVLALEHAGQDVPRCEHVRHQIHVPYALPVSGGRLGSATNSDAGVGAEDIDAPVRGLSFIHKVGDLVLTRDVALDRHATDLSRDGPGAVSVDVRNDDRFRTLFGELPRQRAPYASGSASHDDDAISYVHAT